MIRAIVFCVVALVASDVMACSRCGLFGNRCRFVSQHHEVSAVVAAPIAEPQPAIFAASVYGLSTAVQAYSLDPAAVLRQAAELTRGAQQLADQGLKGYGQTAALALTLQASQPAIQAAVVQPIQQPPQTFQIELRDGKWQIVQPTDSTRPEPVADSPQRPASVAKPARGFPLTIKHCGKCHGTDLASPKGGVYLGGEEQDCKINLSAIAAVLSGRMPPGSQLSQEERQGIVLELSEAK